jgi:hypothetical protein
MATPGEIAGVLGATLSPDTNTRIAAELQLAQALSRPGACDRRGSVRATRG